MYLDEHKAHLDNSDFNVLLLITTWRLTEQYNLGYSKEDALAIFTDNGKYGYIDSVRKIIIPAQYDIAKDFHNGMAYVSKAKKWGYIDRTGREIIPIRYDYIYGYLREMNYAKAAEWLGKVATDYQARTNIAKEGYFKLVQMCRITSTMIMIAS